MGNINLISGQLKVVEGKGSKDRVLYIDHLVVEDLQLWRERQLEEWGQTEYVFTTRTLKQLSGVSVREMIKTYKNKEGIDKNITTHSLRHTFAYRGL